MVNNGHLVRHKGIIYANFDNDGFDEITIGTGNPELDWAEPKPLFHNDGEGHFSDVAQSAGLVHFGMLHGTALADYNDSGNLSLFGWFWRILIGAPAKPAAFTTD